MSRCLFPLNDTAIIFLHSEDTHLPSATVVQVTVKSDGRETVNTIATYFNAQPEIADLINRLITAHLHRSLPQSMVFEGTSYMLTAKHAKWPFGRKKLKFLWGEEDAMACSDKWVFVFKPKVVSCVGERAQ